jgi:beta-N-acetylhexosaminidase
MYATRQEIRRAAGRSIICGFAAKTLDAELKEILREVNPLGLILFTRNLEAPAQAAELGRELKLHRPDAKPMLSIDQEGGRVQRLRAPATEWPAMRTLGRIGDPSLTQKVGAALAAELRAMNFDIDFAPVLDVDTNPKNPVIGDRAFASLPEAVAEQGIAFTKGLQEHGVAACGKHFPGHGDTDLDSHKDLPAVSHELARLREVEWVPFKGAIRAGITSIMTAHVVVEALDPTTPATLTAKALAPLRDELEFDGVIISDDLEMKAVADRYSIEQMAVMGRRAGVDVFLACHKPEVILRLFRALVVAAETKEISHDELLATESRIVAWRDRFYSPPVDPALVKRVVGCGEHLALVNEILERAAQLV